MIGLIKGALGAVAGVAGSLLGSKGQEGGDRLKSALTAGISGAKSGPINAGLLQGISARSDINKAEQAETSRQNSLNAFLGNNSGGSAVSTTPQQNPGTNGTAPANPVFNQGEYDKFNAIANQNYGAMFAPSQS